MDNENLRRHNLAEAKKAEELAALATSKVEADKWRKIAEVYRQLAEEVSE